MILREGAFDPERQDHFLDLAVQLLVQRQQEGPRHLLGNRGATLQGPPTNDVRHIADIAPHHAHVIKAVMLVEILVLGGHKGMDQLVRHRVDRHEHPRLGGVFRQQAAVTGVNPGDYRWLILRQLAVVRQVAAIIDDRPDNQHANRNRTDSAQNQAILQQAAPQRFLDLLSDLVCCILLLLVRVSHFVS